MCDLACVYWTVPSPGSTEAISGDLLAKQREAPVWRADSPLQAPRYLSLLRSRALTPSVCPCFIITQSSVSLCPTAPPPPSPPPSSSVPPPVLCFKLQCIPTFRRIPRQPAPDSETRHTTTVTSDASLKLGHRGTGVGTNTRTFSPGFGCKQMQCGIWDTGGSVESGLTGSNIRTVSVGNSPAFEAAMTNHTGISPVTCSMRLKFKSIPTSL